MSYYVYIVRSKKDHLYTGIAKDPEARVRVHNSGKGSKILRGQLPVKLVWRTSESMPKSDALRLELKIKKLPKKEKEKIVKEGYKLGCDLLIILSTGGSSG